VCLCLIPKIRSRLVPPFEQEATSVLFSSVWAIGSRSNQPYELSTDARLETEFRNRYARLEYTCVAQTEREAGSVTITQSVPVYQLSFADRSPQLLRPRSPLNSSAGEELRPERPS